MVSYVNCPSCGEANELPKNRQPSVIEFACEHCFEPITANQYTGAVYTPMEDR